MVWITRSDDDKEILAEIATQTDRGCALIAAAYLEERLLDAIKARLVRNEKIEGSLFDRSRPLSSFSSKIDLGYLIGIYGPNTHKTLHAVRDIRNDFAHKTAAINFESQRIAQLCKNISISTEINMHNKTTGQKAAMKLDPDGTSKTSFINAIKYLLLVMDLETKQEPPRTPAAPLLPDISH